MKICQLLMPLFLTGAIIGLTPFKFYGDAGYVQSRLWSFWALLVFFAVTLISTAVYIWDPISTEYGDAVNNGIEALADSAEAFMSSIAMSLCMIFNYFHRKMITESLCKLQKMDDILIANKIHPDLKEQFRHLILSLVLVYIAFFVYLYLEISTFIGDESAYQQFLYCAPILITTHVAVQFCTLLVLTYKRFKIINAHFEDKSEYWKHVEIADTDYYKTTFNVGNQLMDPKQFIQERVQCINEFVRKFHYSLCGIVNDINDAYNPQVLLILVQSLVTLISTVYFLVNGLVSSVKIEPQRYIYTLYVSFYCTMQILPIGIASFLISLEAKKTGTIMFKKELHVLRDKEFEHEIHFSMQLLHQYVEIEACHGFPIDASVIPAILGTIATYLLIVIQFELSVQNNVAR